MLLFLNSFFVLLVILKNVVVKIAKFTHFLLKCMEEIQGESVQCCATPLGALCHTVNETGSWGMHIVLSISSIHLLSYTCCTYADVPQFT